MKKIFYRPPFQLRSYLIFAAAHLFLLSLFCSQPEEPVTKSPSLNDFKVTKSVEWAKPGGVSLTMDIYKPNTAKSGYPVLVIFHGGGWVLNNNSTMDSMSIYVVQHGEYIVCNVNYRLLVENNNTVTMNQMIEDVMGAVLWIKDHIAEYGGDASRIVITGDSAGGHLAAMVLLAGDKLESDGFTGNTLGFKPTYLPIGKTAEDVAREKRLDVQGAILSYAALDIYSACINGMETQANIFWMLAGKSPRTIFGGSITVQNNPEYYKAVSPVYIIPKATQRALPPQLCIIGSRDNLISPASVQAYVNQINTSGHKAEYWLYEGKQHAFLDSQKNPYLDTEFRRDAPAALDKMIEFVNTLLLN